MYVGLVCNLIYKACLYNDRKRCRCILVVCIKNDLLSRERKKIRPELIMHSACAAKGFVSQMIAEAPLITAL